MPKLIAALFTLAALVMAVVSGVSTYRVSQSLAELDLADDASTPQRKSEYLGRFISRMESEHLPENGAWIFTNERNRVANQLDVVKSLKQRCDELAKVDPASLGYAQGMQQVTGQEFDHAIDSVKNVFDTALSVKRGWFVFFGWAVFGAIAALLWGWVALNSDI